MCFVGRNISDSETFLTPWNVTMGGGGRRIPRVVTPPTVRHTNVIYTATGNATPPLEDRDNGTAEMKHIQIPPLPRESNLVYEAILLLHVCLFTYLQFLHLYRTVWWLPQSFTSSGMSYHLIDKNVVVFVIALLGRRIPYLVMRNFIPIMTRWVLQAFLTVQMSTWLILAAFHLWQNGHLSILHAIYLFGPFVLYFYVYGLSLKTLWETEELDCPKYETMYSDMNGQQHYSFHHICSNDPFSIRDEVDGLRKEFNKRIKRVVCQCTFIAYYSCFIPWCFVQAYVSYDLWWVSQHLILTWMIVFSLLVSRAFCPEFSDGYHKVACHLGKWTKLKPTHAPSNLWTGEYLFVPGAIVRHQRELYKAEGIFCVASEPGNHSHTRFQILFSGSSFPRLLLGFHISVLLLCFIVIIRATEWYQVISISAMIMTSLFTFVRLGRDFLVVWKMYQAEEMILKQQQQQIN